MNNLNDDMIDLQTRVAYHEDTIAQLNDVVTKQDADIIQLQQQIRLLAKRLDESLFDAQNSRGVSNDRPPHY